MLLGNYYQPEILNNKGHGQLTTRLTPAIKQAPNTCEAHQGLWYSNQAKNTLSHKLTESQLKQVCQWMSVATVQASGMSELSAH